MGFSVNTVCIHYLLADHGDQIKNMETNGAMELPLTNVTYDPLNNMYSVTKQKCTYLHLDINLLEKSKNGIYNYVGPNFQRHFSIKVISQNIYKVIERTANSLLMSYLKINLNTE